MQQQETMKNKLKHLVDDYGGGREKTNETSQMFYDTVKPILRAFNDRPYLEIELFAKYLKEVAKRTCGQRYYGMENSSKPLQNI